MPGAERWPAEGEGLTTLVEDERLPFPDALFDRIVVRHALEEAESPDRLLREIWRVAAPEARILIIVAHRRGLWARAQSTPFGTAWPDTRMQATRLLEDAMFAPQAPARALDAPRSTWGVHRGGQAMHREKIGRFASSRLRGRPDDRGDQAPLYPARKGPSRRAGWRGRQKRSFRDRSEKT